MVDKVLRAIKRAKKPVFLTGAGVSTHSGIPDYRGKDGIYSEDKDKSNIFLKAFRGEDVDIKEVEAYIFNTLEMKDAKPNDIHRWIASHPNATVITQNIDCLHQEAGSKTINYHGSIDKEAKAIDVTFFKDSIKKEVDDKAIETIMESDLIIVVGTTLMVEPFRSLISFAGDFTPRVFINNEKVENGIEFDKELIMDAMDIAIRGLELGDN